MALIEFENNSAPYINADNLNNNFTECNNIVESGSNANGKYVKYSDGTMICYNEVIMDTKNSDYLYQYKEWTFPQAFYSSPLVLVTPMDWTTYRVSTQAENASTTIVRIMLQYVNMDGTAVEYTNYCHASAIAIGKWK